MPKGNRSSKKKNEQVHFELPENRVTLETLLRDTGEFLQMYERYLRRLDASISVVRRGLLEPGHLVRNAELLRRMSERNAEELTGSGPSMALINEFIEKRLKPARLARQTAYRRMGASTEAFEKKRLTASETLGALESLSNAEWQVHKVYARFQKAVATKLDAIGEADRKHDNEKKRMVKLPKNPLVTELARRMQNREQGMPKIEIARQLTSNEKQAKSLLRQLDRFQHLSS